MRPPVRVLCVMDLSCTGRAGLSAVLPALAASGAQGCGLPAALFSTHTGGFGVPARLDTSAFGRQTLEHYARQGVAFDAVYIGYLYGPGQFQLARQALAQWPDAHVTVDPSLGDDGRLYSGISEETVAEMAVLCQKADLITPNATESALLCGQPADAPGDSDAFTDRLNTLSTNGSSVVITSARGPDGPYCTLGCEPGGTAPFSLPSNRLPVRYPGSGDLFTAALLGQLLARRLPLRGAAQAAAGFVEAAVHATYAAGGEARQGLWFEPFLSMLAGSLPQGGPADG